jgi:hypothetical protein
MSDVVAEIRTIKALAEAATGPDLEEACERAERLLRALQHQFVLEVTVGHPSITP